MSMTLKRITLAIVILAGLTCCSMATPLHDAVKNNDLTKVRQLIKGAGPDVINALDAEGSTPLILASVRGELEIVKALIGKGAAVNQTNEGGWTALHCAVNRNYADVAQYLVGKGANVNALTSKGSSALHWATVNQNTELCAFLIKADAAVNARAANGFTPLHWAAYTNAGPIAILLLKHGANMTLTDSNGKTPLAIAQERNSQDAIKALQRYQPTPRPTPAGAVPHGAGRQSAQAHQNKWSPL